MSSGATVVGIFTAKEALHPKSLARLCEIHGFFSPSVLRQSVIPLIMQRTTVSLRALDWLVTNYAKKQHIVFKHRRPDGTECVTNVFADYKSWLKNFRRKNFDQFRRRQRIYFDCDGERFETTVAQLNFLLWAIQSGVIKYADAHAELIERDMCVSMQSTRAERIQAQSQGQKRKRRELSKCPTNQCFVYRLPMTCSFDGAGRRRGGDDGAA